MFGNYAPHNAATRGCPYQPCSFKHSSSTTTPSSSTIPSSTSNFTASCAEENNSSMGGKKDKDAKEPHRLILCFDGTGNRFTGTSSDTNIVKLYQMFDRTHKKQYHYYQPGIGTYSASETSINAGIFGSIKRYFSQLIDQGIGTSFDHHVIAGYKFLMRYYKPGDLVYIFGFSRGAFTARFLARLITHTGLLSRGNEEMVPFAYRTYQEYEQGNSHKTLEEAQAFMDNFKETFCRQDVHVHFLGLFDCVSSVAMFELPFSRKTYLPVQIPSATHIRHAVSIDERRLKFKPALFCQDGNEGLVESEHMSKDIKEVWFPGNHGDVGGGWNPVNDEALQLSDVALEWMLKEIEDLPEKEEERVVFNPKHERFRINLAGIAKARVHEDKTHDALRFNAGWGWVGTICWWILEILPFSKRLELEHGAWVARYWPPNMGYTRDLPDCAVLHSSVVERLETLNTYRPINDGFQDAVGHARGGEAHVHGNGGLRNGNRELRNGYGLRNGV